ncbi:hypothetical protein OG921_04735 [Aldersonia sp. NBC_00410]|uniref:hypothetical protein n=1 Tax=Aldersonia sp. NBC_00410 TaxID=2975954 RepID=UPI002257D4A4|nr:hypothetical protein [Aldersonia sp. NBC_00410]MCX5042478.1 hypothetical protein [Aldersonia sp. NBC_00410]
MIVWSVRIEFIEPRVVAGAAVTRGGAIEELVEAARVAVLGAPRAVRCTLVLDDVVVAVLATAYDANGRVDLAWAVDYLKRVERTLEGPLGAKTVPRRGAYLT